MSENIKWITLNGAHIPIKEGQTKEQAVQEFLAKNKGADKAKTTAPDSEKTTIKDQVKAGADKLKGTKVLAVIPKGKITTDYKTAVTALQLKLSKNGGSVTRAGVGEIQVSKMLKQAKAYIKTPAEIAALSAVPTIIKNGVEIATHEKHKGRDYSTRTIAGKIKINEQDGVLAVVIAKTNENKYKVHRVLTPDGKTLTIEKTTD